MSEREMPVFKTKAALEEVLEAERDLRDIAEAHGLFHIARAAQVRIDAYLAANPHLKEPTP